MACALNQAVVDFVARITRGPFKCLRDYGCEAWSAIGDTAKHCRIVEITRDKLKSRVVLEEEFSIWADEKDRIERDNTRKAALKVAAYDGCPDGLKEQLMSYAELLANRFGGTTSRERLRHNR